MSMVCADSWAAVMYGVYPSDLSGDPLHHQPDVAGEAAQCTAFVSVTIRQCSADSPSVSKSPPERKSQRRDKPLISRFSKINGLEIYVCYVLIQIMYSKFLST